MLYVLGLIWLLALLPASILSGIGVVSALANVKSGFLIASPSDFAAPVVTAVALWRFRGLMEFARTYPSLSLAFFSFVGWAALAALMSLVDPSIERNEFAIGLIRLAKFINSALWCPLIWLAATNEVERRRLVWFFYCGIGIVALLILRDAPRAIAIATAFDNRSGVIKSELPFLGNGASVLLATATCVLIPVIGKKVWHIVAVLPFIAAMLITTGRAGYLGFVAGLAYILWRWKKGKAFVATAGAMSILAVASQVPLVDGAIATMTGGGNRDLLFMDTNGRVDVYAYFFHEIAYKKFFWGSGFGLWGTGSGLPEYTMHNFFLQMWAELGIPGMLLFLWLCFECYRSCDVLRGAGSTSYTVGCRAAMWAVCAACMTETYLYGGPILGTVMFALGMALSARWGRVPSQRAPRLHIRRMQSFAAS